MSRAPYRRIAYARRYRVDAAPLVEGRRPVARCRCPTAAATAVATTTARRTNGRDDRPSRVGRRRGWAPPPTERTGNLGYRTPGCDSTVRPAPVQPHVDP